MLKFAMSLVVTAATLLALEFAVFPLVLPRLPLNVQPFLPEEVAVLAQSSKAGTIPQDYVALTGDSYACLLYTSPSPRDATLSRMPSSA